MVPAEISGGEDDVASKDDSSGECFHGRRFREWWPLYAVPIDRN